MEYALFCCQSAETKIMYSLEQELNPRPLCLQSDIMSLRHNGRKYHFVSNEKHLSVPELYKAVLTKQYSQLTS